MKEPGRFSSSKIIFTVAILLLLFAAGVLAGSRYALMSGEKAKLESLFNLARDGNAGFIAVYSGFLFDQIFYLAAVFLFGLTFLGIAVIPAAVVLKGLTLGVSFSCSLISEGISVYFEKWITYLPAVLCIAVFLLFSAYAYSISLNCCRSLYCKGVEAVSLKSYGLLFVSSLFILAAAGGLHCVLNLLWVILF